MEMAVAGVGRWMAPRGSEARPDAMLLPERMRGRVSLLTCAMAEAMQRTLEKTKVDHGPCATVFGSSFGETAPLLDLLRQAISPNGAVSPLLFMYSVHNNASGCLSVARGDRGFTTSITAGEETFLASLVEAYGLIEQGWDAVTLVVGDEAPPPLLVPEQEQFSTMAVGLQLLSRKGSGAREVLPAIRIRADALLAPDLAPPPPDYLAHHPCVSAYQAAALLETGTSGRIHQEAWGPWHAEVLLPRAS